MYYDVLDKEVKQYLDEYEKIFPEGFPLAQFEGTKEELITETSALRLKKNMIRVFGINIQIMMIN